MQGLGMTAPPPSRSSTRDWTDANVHDPGITVLELLVYTVLALVVGVVIFNTWKSRHATRNARTHGRCAT